MVDVTRDLFVSFGSRNAGVSRIDAERIPFRSL